MAIPWLTALQVIPWGQVLQHAPWVLDQARDLLRRRSQTDESPVTRPSSNDASAAMDPSVMARRIEDLERLTRQQRDMLEEQAHMIAALAEQASTLISAVDRLRSRLRLLIATASVLGLVMLVSSIVGR